MKKAGVIGHPISHSKSPLIHGYWLKKYGIEGIYSAYDIPSESLAEGVNRLIEDGLVGFNVTLPHKQKMLFLCQRLTKSATQIGAVNTVFLNEKGEMVGDNTDAYGFCENLQNLYPDFDWKGKTVAVIGAGGAARAVLYALREKKVGQIRLTNRTKNSADNLGQMYQADVIAWDKKDSIVPDADLIINTTSLGMKGQPPLEIDLSGVTNQTLVYDIVYNPLHTQFLQQARNLGAKTVTGIGMLIHQARPAFQTWFGVMPVVDEEVNKILMPE